MNEAKVNVHELIAWNVDDYAFRLSAQGFDEEAFCEKVRRAQVKLRRRKAYACKSPLFTERTQEVRTLLDRAALRADLHEEYRGLNWRLGIVDLRYLVAFQRRLIFSPARKTAFVPQQNDWSKLIAFALASQRSTEHRIIQSRAAQGELKIELVSNNPDLQIKRLSDASCDTLPFALYGGSPSFEVAEFRGRWFLRDGYHRAYRLLQAGVHLAPAVVIRARTIHELGATEPWFFSENYLFSDRPPHVTDFLDDEMIICYKRAALRKVIRIRIEESLEQFPENDEVEREQA